MIIDEDEYLAHFGKKGMKWGVRRKNSDETASTGPKDHRKLKIAGAVVAAGSIAAGAAYAHHVLGKRGTNRLMSGKDRSNAAQKIRAAKEFAEKTAKQEPTSVIHVARGKHTGYKVLKRGGLTDALPEIEKGFGTSSNASEGIFKRYGNAANKIAVSFHDPKGRADFAGRPIVHQVILPEQHAKNIGTHMAAVRKAWQLVGPDYEKHWQESLKPKY